LSKEGKMSGLFNLLHKPPPQQTKIDIQDVDAEIELEQEVEQQKLKDKSAGEFDEDVDQEVDGLFFGELSPCDNSGVVSNLGLANLNKELEDNSPDGHAIS
jgi:hypothetical protein